MSSSMEVRSKRRPRSKQRQQKQHQFILPKYITASNGLTINRQLTKWINTGHELDVLVLRGPSQRNSNRGVDDEASSTQGVGYNDEGGGIPPYLIGPLQDLILSKPEWKKIEFSGKTPHATERILQSTMILREGATRDSVFGNVNDRKSRSGYDFGGRCVQQLDKLVVEHATVRILNSLADILNPEDVPSLSSPMEGLILSTTNIHRLALRWTEFSAASIQALSRGLLSQTTRLATRTNPPLQGLFLTGSTFTEEGIPLFSEMLRSTTSLVELSLSDCHLEDEEAASIVHSLSETPHPHLKSLDVSCNYVQEQATDSIARLIFQRTKLLNASLCKATTSSASLLSLDISNQDVWDNRAYLQPLMDALAGVGQSTEPDNGDTDVPRSTFATSVESIDWSHNFLNDVHIESLCRCFSRSASLPTKISLQKLVLRGNAIADNGLLCLAEALPAMVNLKVLDLRLNPKITLEGVNILTEALQQLHTQLSPCTEKVGVPRLRIRSMIGRSLWHIFLDQPTQAFLMQLVLHRAGRTWLLFQESRGVTLSANLWPVVLERANRCIQADVDSFDEEVCIHGIYAADLIYDLFRLGHASFMDGCR
jgi:Leucine Rich repeat